MGEQHNWHRTDEQGRCNLRTKGGTPIHRVLATDIAASPYPVLATTIDCHGNEQIRRYTLDGRYLASTPGVCDVDWTEPTVEVTRWVVWAASGKSLWPKSYWTTEVDARRDAIGPHEAYVVTRVTIPLPASVAKAVQG